MRKVVIKLLTFVDRLGFRMAIMAGAVILFMALITTYEVVTRYGFNRPTYWTLELCQYLLVACVFLAAGYATLTGAHVRVDILVKRFSRRNQIILEMVITAISLFFWIFLVWKSFEFARTSWVGDWHAATKLGAPLFPSIVCIPVGSFVLCWQLLSKFRSYFVSLSAKAQQANEEGQASGSSQAVGLQKVSKKVE